MAAGAPFVAAVAPFVAAEAPFVAAEAPFATEALTAQVPRLPLNTVNRPTILLSTILSGVSTCSFNCSPFLTF